MRIAIIGSGISGLAVAHGLRGQHELTVFEAGDHIGGHAWTIEAGEGAARQPIDVGFIVFNHRTYPHFTRLLGELGVETRETSMSFSVRSETSGREYGTRSLAGLFAQKRNLLRPSFWGMLREILRFNHSGATQLAMLDERTTVGEFLEAGGYSRAFAENYLLPMGSAIWSCPMGKFADFPIRFILEFYANHGLLTVAQQPAWRTIVGGSRVYVDALSRPFRDAIRLRTPVHSVRRRHDGVEVRSACGAERFDHVVFGCHSDEALKLLADPTPTEREVLGAFPYERSSAVLHTDVSLLPRRRAAWASWNYLVRTADDARATVTYHMNRLQHLRGPEQYCVTLNGDDLIAPDRVLRRFVFHHPVFTRERAAAQRRHGELVNANRTSFCGAYWRNGFHEDGLVSAQAVCRALNAAPQPAPLSILPSEALPDLLPPERSPFPVSHAKLPL